MQKNRVKKYGCFFIVFALILTVATFYKMHYWKEVKDYGLFNVKRLYDVDYHFFFQVVLILVYNFLMFRFFDMNIKMHIYILGGRNHI